MKKLKIPQWLDIAGQSGSGKSSILKHIFEFYKQNNLNYIFVSNGEIVREFCKGDSFAAKKMKEINDQSKLQPLAIMLSMWLPKMLNILTPELYIIHDGSPRSFTEVKLVSDIAKAGYVHSYSVLEIFAPDAVCIERLKSRTQRDKRLDLSIEGSPGVPDLSKIEEKISWWSNNKPLIIKTAKEEGVSWVTFENIGEEEHLKTEVFKMLTV